MKLFYFTASYPFGIGEQWKANELKELVHHFDQITVVPYAYEGNFKNPKTLPDGVQLLGPLFETGSFGLNKATAFIRILTSKYAGAFLNEFFRKRVYKRRIHLISWLYASRNVIRLMNNDVISQISAALDKQTIFYFFWGKGSVEILPFIDTALCFKTFVRMHRYDLFETVNNNYIPYRHPLLDKADTIAPSSEAGRQHLIQLYPEFQDKIKLFRLGTLGNGKRASASSDNILRVVSCSFLSPVKRVDLMIKSLKYVDFPVLWRHIGDGVQRKEMEGLIRQYALQDKFIIEGILDSEKVLEFYTDHAFDLFVNTSESEGVPFSIMEAFSVGIPVMATNVGGSGEIVKDEVGKLLPANPEPEILARCLKEFYDLPEEDKRKKRDLAYQVYVHDCNADRLTNELQVYLQS